MRGLSFRILDPVRRTSPKALASRLDRVRSKRLDTQLQTPTLNRPGLGRTTDRENISCENISCTCRATPPPLFEGCSGARLIFHCLGIRWTL